MSADRVPQEVRYGSAGAIEWRQLSTRDKRFLKRAAGFARKREVDFQNHAAVAVRGGKIIGIGLNAYKNDPRVLSAEHVRAVPGRNGVMGVGVHAEVAALNQLADGEGVTLYVVRVTKDGEVAESQPCEGCVAAMEEAGIKRVVWTRDGMNLD